MGLDPPPRSGLTVGPGRGHSMVTQHVTHTDHRAGHVMTEDAFKNNSSSEDWVKRGTDGWL